MGKPFESPRPHCQQLERRGRAGLILNRQPALVCQGPGKDLSTERPFSRWRALPPLQFGTHSPPQAGLSGAGFPGQDSGRHIPPTPHPWSQPASPHPGVERRELVSALPLLPVLARSLVAQTCPPRPRVSPGMCPGAPGPQPAFLTLQICPASQRGRERRREY